MADYSHQNNRNRLRDLAILAQTKIRNADDSPGAKRSPPPPAGPPPGFERRPPPDFGPRPSPSPSPSPRPRPRASPSPRTSPNPFSKPPEPVERPSSFFSALLTGPAKNVRSAVGAAKGGSRLTGQRSMSGAVAILGPDGQVIMHKAPRGSLGRDFDAKLLTRRAKASALALFAAWHGSVAEAEGPDTPRAAKDAGLLQCALRTLGDKGVAMSPLSGVVPALTRDVALQTIWEYFGEQESPGAADTYFVCFAGVGAAGTGDWQLADGVVTLQDILELWYNSDPQKAATLGAPDRGRLLILILDCCHSGKWAEAAAARRLPNVAIQAACAGDQIALNGAFTEAWHRVQRGDGDALAMLSGLRKMYSQTPMAYTPWGSEDLVLTGDDVIVGAGGRGQADRKRPKHQDPKFSFIGPPSGFFLLKDNEDEAMAKRAAAAAAARRRRLTATAATGAIFCFLVVTGRLRAGLLKLGGALRGLVLRASDLPAPGSPASEADFGGLFLKGMKAVAEKGKPTGLGREPKIARIESRKDERPATKPPGDPPTTRGGGAVWDRITGGKR